ncbi:DMT family transporter [Evansella sp. LMS18]|uniref:DMT family transporter n=1 Tax=Evansella sp. LMS18 TaxID=2924033 RepID=UPI0020D0A106|nr:DMT family transporter [Evansella sp. LMS18]UTR09774.1 DMT family transporter [Evansella sp. LMS18]
MKLSRGLTYSLLIVVMIIWGLNVTAVKFLVDHFPPVAMQGFRILVAGATAIIVLYFMKDLRRLTRKEWVYVLTAAVFGQLCHHGFLAAGLVETTASNASLILGLIPITTSIMAIIFFRDRLTLLRTIGIFLGFAGVSLVVIENNGAAGISRGDLFVFISMLAQAFSFILIKKLTETMSSKQATAIMLLIGSTMLISTSFILEGESVGDMASGTPLVWTVFFVSAILATGLGHILYNSAIHHIGAGQTAVFNNLVPLFALTGAVIFLGESLYYRQVAGFILIVTGVLFGTGYIDTKLQARKRKEWTNDGRYRRKKSSG